MNAKRTPDERFEGLEGFSYAPNYLEVEDLRVHYVDEGPNDAEPVLMMHGEPSWSYLYRKMIPVFVEAGFRAVAPDLVGFGRSDKPDKVEDYSYQRHVDWMTAWLNAVDLSNATLICQDWGSLIGLRLAAEQPDRFARIVVSNGFLPTGDRKAPTAFKIWRAFAKKVPKLPVGRIIKMGCKTKLSDAVIAGYEAPFPDESFKAGARVFPELVPTTPDDPAASANRAAWEVLKKWEKPLLTAFADGDPIMRGADRVFQKYVPGAQGQPHTIIRGAGHFIQEDKGEELARVALDFMKKTPI